MYLFYYNQCNAFKRVLHSWYSLALRVRLFARFFHCWHGAKDAL
uniref:Uncharacterized protein n=1 Tax=Anguilla anguilla TaxID=7936 RepID=A0A0E9Q2F0_ANGAN